MLLLASTASAAPPHVVVLDLELSGEINPGVREALMRQLRGGLTAAETKLISVDRTKRALQGKGCNAPACWRRVAGKLGGRFVVGGTVTGEDRSYTLELWLADGYSGKILARVHQRCDICGLAAVASKMDLAASALRAKVESTAGAPARISIQSDPPGATLYLDGDALGSAPQQLDLPPGDHVIEARIPDHMPLSRKVHAVAGVEERVDLRLIPNAPTGRRYRTVAGWIVLGAGVASLATAAALFAIHGRATRCDAEQSIPGGQCPQTRDTRAGAWTAAGVGLGAAVLGAYLLLDSPRRRRDVAWAF